MHNLQKTGFALFAKDMICTTCLRQDLHNSQKTGFVKLAKDRICIIFKRQDLQYCSIKYRVACREACRELRSCLSKLFQKSPGFKVYSEALDTLRHFHQKDKDEYHTLKHTLAYFRSRTFLQTKVIKQGLNITP